MFRKISDQDQPGVRCAARLPTGIFVLILGKSKNEDACMLLRKNNRVVMLSRQTFGVNKAIKKIQTKEGGPDHKVHALVRMHTICWGNQYLQIERNNQCPLILLSRSSRGTTRATMRPSWSRTSLSEEGSKAGKAVSASEIGLTSTDWEEDQELEGFLRYPYQIQEMIEHKVARARRV
jgi:hypothetical protein